MRVRAALLAVGASCAALLVPMQSALAAPHAIDAAPSGARITVAPGTYTEEVVISKNLELRGSGMGRTVIKAPTSLTSYGVHLPDGRDLTAIVRVDNHARVRMSGFTVSGPIPCDIEVSGINVLQAATLDLSDTRVTSLHVAASACGADHAAGRGVVYGIPPHIVAEGVRGSTAYGRISRVVIDGYQHAGISIAGPDTGGVSHVDIVDNVVTGGANLPSFQYGIQVAGSATANVVGNHVSGNVCAADYCGPDPINQGQGIGIAVQSAVSGSTVVGNVAVGNDVGVYQVDSPVCCTIASNVLIRNRYFGLLMQDGDGTAHDNVIVGGQIGIGVVADFVDTTAYLSRNVIAATSDAPVREIDCCGVTATAVVTH
jgi:Right handed beta helix region